VAASPPVTVTEAPQAAASVPPIAVGEELQADGPVASSLPIPFVVRSTGTSALAVVPPPTSLLLPALWLPQGKVIGLRASDLPVVAAVIAAARRAPADDPLLAAPSPEPPSTATASGGRFAAVRSSAPAGFGFGSPIGRFAITRSGILLGGANNGDASVSLVVPGSLVLLAALVGVAAALSQRRVERRRRVLR
jgi:hypothetical protein